MDDKRSEVYTNRHKKENSIRFVHTIGAILLVRIQSTVELRKNASRSIDALCRGSIENKVTKSNGTTWLTSAVTVEEVCVSLIVD